MSHTYQCVHMIDSTTTVITAFLDHSGRKATGLASNFWVSVRQPKSPVETLWLSRLKNAATSALQYSIWFFLEDTNALPMDVQQSVQRELLVNDEISVSVVRGGKKLYRLV